MKTPPAMAAQALLDALRDLLAVTPARAPGAGLLVGAEERHRAAIDAARAAIDAARAQQEHKSGVNHDL